MRVWVWGILLIPIDFKIEELEKSYNWTHGTEVASPSQRSRFGIFDASHFGDTTVNILLLFFCSFLPFLLFSFSLGFFFFLLFHRFLLHR